MKTKDSEDTGFPERLRLVMGTNSLREFAQLIGISYSALYQYLAGKSEPTRPVLLAIVKKMGVSVEWLVCGRETPPGSIGEADADGFPASLASGVKEAPRKGYVYLPVIETGATSSGSAFAGREPINEALSFKESWLKKEFGADPRFLFLMTVQGESMEPTLRPGELVLINRNDSQNFSDGLFAIRMSQAILVKRLQRIPGGGIKLASDNPRYESFTVSPDNVPESFSIIGRVVWNGRKL